MAGAATSDLLIWLFAGQLVIGAFNLIVLRMLARDISAIFTATGTTASLVGDLRDMASTWMCACGQCRDRCEGPTTSRMQREKGS